MSVTLLRTLLCLPISICESHSSHGGLWGSIIILPCLLPLWSCFLLFSCLTHPPSATLAFMLLLDHPGPALGPLPRCCSLSHVHMANLFPTFNSLLRCHLSGAYLTTSLTFQPAPVPPVLPVPLTLLRPPDFTLSPNLLLSNMVYLL